MGGRRQEPVGVVDDNDAAPFDFRQDAERQTAARRGVDQRVVERCIVEEVYRAHKWIAVHCVLIVFALEIVRHQPIVHIRDVLALERRCNLRVVRGVRLVTDQVPRSPCEEARRVSTAPFYAIGVVTKQLLQIADGSGRQRRLFGTKGCTNRGLQTVTKVLRRPMIEAPVRQGDANLRAKIHLARQCVSMAAHRQPASGESSRIFATLE